ncbi:hypothetical protein BC827DRAFT_1211965 [Russula dissimulans]|nr:hypothetical protein BC827DRAFT_1211965 [Russula dissimulans]
MPHRRSMPALHRDLAGRPGTSRLCIRLNPDRHGVNRNNRTHPNNDAAISHSHAKYRNPDYQAAPPYPSSQGYGAPPQNREGVALCHLPQQQWGLPPQGQQQCESRSGETIPSLGGLYSKISGFARRLRTRKSPISTVRRRSASCRTRSTRRCLPLMAL